MSNDTDLVEPIALTRDALEGGVIVFSPNVGQPARDLERVATHARRVSDRVLAACHFPNELEDQHGVIREPPEW